MVMVTRPSSSAFNMCRNWGLSLNKEIGFLVRNLNV